MVAEKFRDWRPTKKINIVYTNPETKERFRTQLDTGEITVFICKTIDHYAEMGLKLTVREIYYALVAEDMIPNAQETYKRICTLVTDMRYGGILDWEAVEDRGRTPSMPLEFENVQERIELAVNNFRLKRWKDQKFYVEMYCEKQAKEGQLKPIAEKYHIYFGSNKGYSSASTMYEMAKRFSEKIKEGKRVRLLYFGDHDPSGLDMIRDLHVRICEFFTAGDDFTDPLGDEDDCKNFEIIPVALTAKQIARYRPPPNPAKITDPRAKWYLKEVGNKSWELDALKPEVLMRIAEESIQEFLDIESYNAIIKKEEKDIKALRNFGKKMSS